MFQNMDMIAFTIILVLFISLITNNSASCIPNDGMVNNIQNNNVNNNQTNEQNENQNNNNLNIETIKDHDSSIKGYNSTDDFTNTSVGNNNTMNALKLKLNDMTSKYNPSELLPQQVDDSQLFNTPYSVEQLNSTADLLTENELLPTVTSTQIPNLGLRKFPPIPKRDVSPWFNSTATPDTTGLKVCID
jgi:hypothetical protein